MLANLPMAVYVCDADGRIVSYNARAAELWGREPSLMDDSELFCGSYKLHFDGRQIARDETPMAHVLRTGEPVHGREGLVERPDGSQVWAMVHIDPITDDDGELIGAINCFHDITAQKRVEAERIQAEEDLRQQERWYSDLLQALPAPIYTTDAEGRITFYNRAAAELAGVEPRLGVDEWCVSWKLFRPDGTPLRHDECPMARTLKEGKPSWGEEAIAERPDGRRVPFRPYPTPLFDRSGALVGAVNLLLDISASKAAEAALGERDQRLEATYQHANIGIAEIGPDGRYLRVNPALCAITGYSAEEMLDFSFFDMPHPDDIEPDRTLYCQQAAGALKRYAVEKRYIRKDGRVVWVAVDSSAVRDHDGKVAYSVRVIQDITERRNAEARQKVLLDELNHRVKNTLATVQSIALQTARNAPTMDAFTHDFEARLVALSKAHDLLTRDHWEGADLGDILRQELAPFGDGPVRLEGPKLTLAPRSTLALAMAFHEMATNAAKYGALSTPDGRLDVRWDVAPRSGERPARLSLSWTENGGPPVAPPRRRGFGARLVERTINGDLGGSCEMRFDPEGVRCEIQAPLDPRP
ncbi:MAG: PAS domain S-box protein [Caulobacteraceae bacterium]